MRTREIPRAVRQGIMRSFPTAKERKYCCALSSPCPHKVARLLIAGNQVHHHVLGAFGRIISADEGGYELLGNNNKLYAIVLNFNESSGPLEIIKREEGVWVIQHPEWYIDQILGEK